jgi:hypothetical protein
VLETPPDEPLLQLPRLQHLKLGWLPLTDASLLSVLSRCPELETMDHFCLKHVSKAGLEAAFRCCPKLSGETDRDLEW